MSNEQPHGHSTSGLSPGVEKPPSMNPADALTHARRRPSVTTLVKAIERADRAALSKAITLIESTKAADRDFAERILDHLPKKDGLSIGITGAPGVGKSTLIEAFGIHLLQRGHRVAVLAIDPSSIRTKGSILGDKTRMPQLATDSRAYVRPTPTGRASGGVAESTRSTIRICEAAGFDIVLVETTGVGQSEFDVYSMVDVFLLLINAHAGDELQGIKRGIMELADAVVVTKADGDQLAAARRASSTYRRALSLSASRESGWKPPVLICSGRSGDGIADLWNTVESFIAQGLPGRSLEHERGARADIVREVERLLGAQFVGRPLVKRDLDRLQTKVAGGDTTPRAAARALLDAHGA